MMLMMEQKRPNDAIIASGTSYTVYHWLETALQLSGLDIQGEWNMEKTSWISKTGNVEIQVDQAQIRSYEGRNTPKCDPWILPSLGWQTSFPLKDIIADMIK
jgi:GDP-D-mannose dehydratase